MKPHLCMALSVVFLFAAFVCPVFAQKDVREQDRSQMQEQMQEQVYGWQLMTEQERLEYRQQMRQLQTVGEQEEFRREHHEQMKERASKMGVTLPDEPRPRGKGMGVGGGMGPGGGMGGRR